MYAFYALQTETFGLLWYLVVILLVNFLILLAWPIHTKNVEHINICNAIVVSANAIATLTGNNVVY